MAYTLFKIVTFPPYKTGLSTVGYALYNADGTLNTARTTTGVAERGTGTGIYGASVSFPNGFIGELRWDTGEAAEDIMYASEEFNTILPLESGSVTGTPGAASFRGDSALSASNNFYSDSYLAFTSGTNRGLARIISGYAGATKEFTFENAFPVAPAAADTFHIIGGVG